jgi:hypothetical protein
MGMHPLMTWSGRHPAETLVNQIAELTSFGGAMAERDGAAMSATDPFR